MRLVRAVAMLLLAGLILAVGIALGQALGDSDVPSGSVTQVRTLKPLPLAPARETITVTVTAP
jgi:hypothetical protein